MILKQNIRSGSDVKTTVTTTTTTKVSERSKVLFLMSSLFFNGSHRLYIDDYGMYFFITALTLLKSVVDEFFTSNLDMGLFILDSEKIQTFIELVGYIEVLQVLLNCLTKQKRFGDVVFDQDNVENAFRLSILVIVGFVYGIYNEHFMWFTYQDISSINDLFSENKSTTETTQHDVEES